MRVAVITAVVGLFAVGLALQPGLKGVASGDRATQLSPLPGKPTGAIPESIPVERPKDLSDAQDAPAALTEWKEATAGYQFSFPKDHASHEPYRIEWWYYTGNIQTADGRRFGYQLTFFRTGIVPFQPNPSRWAIRDLYLAHFAISDIEGGRFHYFDRLNRAGVGWAGASTNEYKVWNEDWQVSTEGAIHHLTAAVIPGEEDDSNSSSYTCSIDLTLEPLRKETIHGEKGVSQKGSGKGDASHYYSITRLQTKGKLRVDGQEFDITGLSWMDHEFGSSILEEGQIGWDWFSIQLDDGRDLMLFELRRADGSVDPNSSGTMTNADGSTVHLTSADFTLTPGTASGETWKSDASGATYPIEWRIQCERLALDLNAMAAMPNQELRTSASTGVTYWEGSVSAQDSSSKSATAGRGGNVRGQGYLEMTGYTGTGLGRILH